MENIYIGKKIEGSTETAICKVLYSDIRTGNAVVFNRHTMKYDTVKYNERVFLNKNIRQLAENTEYQFK